MPITNVSHIAIGVRAMEVALPFWTEVVGLHVSLDTEEQFTIGGEVIRRRGVYLREAEGPNEPFIVLDEQLTRPKSGDPKALFEIGVHHFGFWVDDIDAIATRARAAGVPIVAEPSERGADTAAYGEPPGGFVRSMFVRDPEGNTVQFDQRVPQALVHRSKLNAALVDVPADLYDRAVTFWARAIGREPDHDPDNPDYADFGQPVPGMQFMVQRVGAAARVHLDIETDDVEAEVRRLEALGAVRVAAVKSWWVMRDPAGLLFCVVRVQTGEAFEPLATTWA